MSEQMIQGLALLHPELILVSAALVLLMLARRVRGTRVALAITLIAALTAGFSAGGGQLAWYGSSNSICSMTTCPCVFITSRKMEGVFPFLPGCAAAGPR